MTHTCVSDKHNRTLNLLESNHRYMALQAIKTVQQDNYKTAALIIEQLFYNNMLKWRGNNMLKWRG